jgi:hypothetical protein
MIQYDVKTQYYIFYSENACQNVFDRPAYSKEKKKRERELLSK